MGLLTANGRPRPAVIYFSVAVWLLTLGPAVALSAVQPQLAVALCSVAIGWAQLHGP